MPGFSAIQMVKNIKVNRKLRGTNNEIPETIQLVTSTSGFSQDNDRCYNFFIILVYYAVGIGIIVLGMSYLNNCPAEKMIPIGLIIFGGIFVVSRLLNCVYDYRSVFQKEHVDEDVPYWLIFFTILLTVAELGVFISLVYWLTNIDIDKASKDPRNYCDPTLIYTVLWGIVEGIFVILSCLCTCCLSFTCCEEQTEI